LSGLFDELTNSVAQAEERARHLGLQVLRPASDELFVDLDSQIDNEMFAERLRQVLNFVGVTAHFIKISPSGEEWHYHAYVKLTRPVENEYERLVLHLLLGSDRMREYFSWARLTKGEKDPSVFFEKTNEKPEYIIQKEQESSRIVNFEKEENTSERMDTKVGS
jgi:hypothetical protein